MTLHDVALAEITALLAIAAYKAALAISGGDGLLSSSAGSAAEPERLILIVGVIASAAGLTADGLGAALHPAPGRLSFPLVPDWQSWGLAGTQLLYLIGKARRRA